MLLIAISFTAVQASETKKETVEIEIGTITSKENSITEKMSLSDEQLIELETLLSNLIIKLESAKSGTEINNILENYLQKNFFSFNLIKNIIDRLINRLIKLKGFFSPGLVISFGRGYNLNPFKTTGTRLFNHLCIWHYTKGTTFIWKPIKKIAILRGMQLGYMLNFKGLYMHIANKYPKMSYTFFIGLPNMIHGMRLNRMNILFV
jgi:hypothetical protein